jgi:hypothetical protein
MIESDLELIINAFEKGTLKSRDVDSVFIPLRRQLETFVSYPQSIMDSIDKVPLPTSGEDSRSGLPSAGQVRDSVPPAVQQAITPEQVGGVTDGTLEDSDVDGDDWQEKVKDWMTKCIPCTGEFKRAMTSMDVNFYADIETDWEKSIDLSMERLEKLEFELDDVDVTPVFCDLGFAFKSSCTPDIKKMNFIMSSFLDKMEMEISPELGTFESFLISSLSPVFNEMAANLDVISSLAIKPVKCTLDHFRSQIKEASNTARRTALTPVLQELQQQRARFQRSSDKFKVKIFTSPRTPPPYRSEAELEAERSMHEERLRQRMERNIQATSSKALSRVQDVVEDIEESFTSLAQFEQYLTTATTWLEERKDWFLKLIKELVDKTLDSFDDKLAFAKGKKDILTYTSIMNGMLDASKAGDFSCGPEIGSMTEKDVGHFVDHWQHPSESLEIIVENGNIVTRRRPTPPPMEDSEAIGDTQVDGVRELPNVVVRRPISSCLKKVTTDEAEQVQHWIRQLEQEV